MPILIATAIPPVFVASPALTGRLVFDFGLGAIWSVKLQTGRVTRLHTTDQVFPTEASAEAAAPGDAPIVYAGTAVSGDSTTGRFGIYLGDQVLIPPADGFSYQEPVWSRDGQSMFVTRVGVAPGTWVKGTSGLVIQVAAVTAPISLTTVVSDAFQAAPSPDGKRLAYIHIDATKPLSPTRSVRVRSLVDRADSEVVPSSMFGDVYGPRWLNDRQLVFAALRSPLSGRAHDGVIAGPSIGAVTAMMDALLGHGVAQAHSWQGDIWRVDVSTGGGLGLARLTAQSFTSPVIAPSPDGRFVAVMAMDGLWIMNADGTDLHQISGDGGNGSLEWIN